MKKYIELEAAYNAIVRNYAVDEQLSDLGKIPAADVVPVRHGRWVEVEVKELAYYKMMIASMRCDQCGRYHNEVYHYGNPTEMAKYCGFCGALMDKDGDGE